MDGSSVKRWLWSLMKEFSNEFDYDNGDSDWHIFDRQNTSIRVEQKKGPEHVLIWPKVDEMFFQSDWDWVDLLYVDCITYLCLYSDSPNESPFKDVGPKGVWTARYTQEWLTRKFIPKVLSHYAQLQLLSQHEKKGKIKKIVSNFLMPNRALPKLSEEQCKTIIQKAVMNYSEKKDIPLLDVREPKQFASYLHRIQSWFLHYGADNIPASMLQAYYTTFTELAQHTDPTTVKIDYLRGKLGGVQRLQRNRQKIKRRFQDLSTYDNVLKYLKQQVTRIHEVDYENHHDAELLSRAFISIIENGTIHFQQDQLNAAKEALMPLWRQYRFYYHFIEPIFHTM